MLKKLLAVAFVLSLTVTAAGCGKKEAPVQAEARVQTVSVFKVAKSDMTNKLTIGGKISPMEEIKVVPKSPGKVARVNCDVGQAVAAGAVLIELENSDIQARLDSARAALAVSEANLEKARAQLEKNRIQVDDAKRNFERRKALFDAGAASQSDFEAARSGYETAQKDYDINAAGLASSQASVDQSRASLRQAEVDLENSLVRSPISGLVASRSVNAGEFITNSTPAVVVVNIDSVEVSASLAEDEINHVKLGQEVNVSITAASPAPFKGKVSKVSPAADAKSKTYPVWVSIPNPQKVLKPGMFAEIQLATVKRQGVLAVPADAVLERNGHNVVFVAEGEKAVEKKVKVGLAGDGKKEITEGLAEGESLIVTGLQGLRNGAPVKVQAPTREKGN
ncbi:MAG: efflux RND transporter periplasmic adaptor subunit [Bacillota bacterium]